MAVVKATKKVTSTPVAKKEAPKPVVKPVVKKTTTTASVAKKATPVAKKEAPKPVTKPVSKKSVAKKSVAKAPAPVKKPVTKKPEVKGGKKLKSSNKATNSFAIIPGKQATQEAFLHSFFTKLRALGYDEVTKDQAKSIMKAYSTTLKEVTDVASFQDTTANIYYARRIIDTRVTQPPKAAEGLQTLMLKHPELKVRKLLVNEDDIKFSGHISEDDPNIFITVDGTEINLSEATAEEDTTPAVEETEEEEVTEEVVEETESEDEDVEEATAELEEEVAEEDDSDDEADDEEDEDSLFSEDEE